MDLVALLTLSRHHDNIVLISLDEGHPLSQIDCRERLRGG